jgi:hypothetical protein
LVSVLGSAIAVGMGGGAGGGLALGEAGVKSEVRNPKSETGIPDPRRKTNSGALRFENFGFRASDFGLIHGD